MTIDHLVYAVQDLETGMVEIENLLGVRPAIGGHHPGFGTHNALLSLGSMTYLEIIARDPELPIPDRGLPFGMGPGQQSRISTWALRTETIRALAGTAVAAGINIGAIQAGSRDLSDGSALTWELTDPNAMPLDGAVPFLIDWGNSVHPAGTAPHGGELTSIRIEHPEPDEVGIALRALGVDIEMNKADYFTLTATIRTDRGIVELK